jgi:N-acetylglucosamine kinase-like BadF-type ATPase
VEEVHFYGAGCKAEAAKQTVMRIFEQAFPQAVIKVETDMLGAARALFGKGEGIACILGTGANAAVCQNGELLAEAPSLGIWLGDEGSGGHLGKTLITSYLYGELPSELHAAFEKTYTDRRDYIIECVYRKPGANAYLASFAPFLKENAQHVYVQQLLKQAFGAFFERIIVPLQKRHSAQLALGAVGSIAQHFAEPLQAVGHQWGIQVAHLMPAPIEALARYHQK